MNEIRLAVEQRLGQHLNHALVQWYRGGTDYISEHADKVSQKSTERAFRGVCRTYAEAFVRIFVRAASLTVIGFILDTRHCSWNCGGQCEFWGNPTNDSSRKAGMSPRGSYRQAANCNAEQLNVYSRLGYSECCSSLTRALPPVNAVCAPLPSAEYDNDAYD